MNRLLHDLRFALRRFGRRPALTATTLAVLALGMAVAASLFSFVRGYTLQPPPGVPQTAELVRVRGAWSTPYGAQARLFSPEEFAAQGAAGVFSAVAGWQHLPVAIERQGLQDPEWLDAGFVGDGYFELIGVPFAAGTGFAARRDAGPLVAVISHALRQRRFPSDAAAIGATLTVAGQAVTVIGVTTPRFQGVHGTDGEALWLPEAARLRLLPEAAAGYGTVARLAPGVTRAEASAAMAALASHAADEAAGDPRLRRTPTSEVLPLATMNADPDFDREIRNMMTGLTLLAVLVLLVTGTNASALQTGVAMTRGREIAMRYSLGASRGRVLRQLLAESALLGSLAGATACGLAYALKAFVDARLPPAPFEIPLDGVAVGVTVGLGVLTGMLAGLSPALHAVRAGLASTLKAGSGGASGRRHRALSGLVVAQVLLTQPLVVMLTALLLILVTDLQRTGHSPAAAQVVTLQLRASGAEGAGLDPQRETERLQRRLAGLPGVQRVVRDPRQDFWFSEYVGTRAAGPARTVDLHAQAVPAGWFDVMGETLRSGRDFVLDEVLAEMGAGDTAVVIGEDLAAALWPGTSPLGHRLASSGSTPARRLVVVGVVATPEGKARRPGEGYVVYLPPPAESPEIALRLRMRGEAAGSLDMIRAELRRAAPGLGVVELRTLAAIEAEARRALLYGGLTFSALGLIALLLAAVGLYALVAFVVAQRGGEIAVRLAVGARTGQVVCRTMREGLRLTGIGLLLGLPLSLAGLAFVFGTTSMLPPVPVWQVGALALAGVAAIALLATWLPARRAARIAPADVLRVE